jgi:hypothetical protein
MSHIEFMKLCQNHRSLLGILGKLANTICPVLDCEYCMAYILK